MIIMQGVVTPDSGDPKQSFRPAENDNNHLTMISPHHGSQVKIPPKSFP